MPHVDLEPVRHAAHTGAGASLHGRIATWRRAMSPGDAGASGQDSCARSGLRREQAFGTCCLSRHGGSRQGRGGRPGAATGRDHSAEPERDEFTRAASTDVCCDGQMGTRAVVRLSHASGAVWAARIAPLVSPWRQVFVYKSILYFMYACNLNHLLARQPLSGLRPLVFVVARAPRRTRGG